MALEHIGQLGVQGLVVGVASLQIAQLVFELNNALSDAFRYDPRFETFCPLSHASSFLHHVVQTPKRGPRIQCKKSARQFGGENTRWAVVTNFS